MAHKTTTGGRDATTAVIPGRFALSVGKPPLSAPKGWRWTPLSSLARLESGHTPSRTHPEYWGGEIPWIGIKDATGNHGRVLADTEQHTNQLGIDNSSSRVLPEGTVCLSRTASVGYVVVMGKPMATSQDFANWVCGEGLNPHFLKYVLLAEQDSLHMYSTGTTHQTIYYPELKAFHVCVPDRKEQDAIVDVLYALDRKIDLNRGINERLESMTRVMFEDWFVDFGPVRAKSEGRSPYLAQEIWALFPDRLDSEGKPNTWVAGNLGNIARLAGRVVNPEALDPATPYIGLEHMPRRSIALDTWGEAGKVISGKLSFQRGDFLFGKLRPYFHKVGIAPIDGICSTDIVVLNAKQSIASSFVMACISREEFVAYTDRTSGGTKMPRTSWDLMARYDLVLPPDNLIKAFESIASPFLGRIVSNIHESRALAQLRDILLPKLMSGEIRLRDAEKLVRKVS